MVRLALVMKIAIIIAAFVALPCWVAIDAIVSMTAEPLPGDADGCCGPTDECEVCR